MKKIIESDIVEHKEKDRVLHVLTSLNFGGVERHLEILAENEAESHKDFYFCALGSGGATEERLLAIGAHLTCLNKKTQIPSFGAIIGLYNLIRRLRPEVVHAHGAEANFHALLAASLARVPVRIGEEIGIPVHSWRAKQIFRQIYRLADCVIGVSDTVKDWLIENKEVPAEKAVCIYNPVVLSSPVRQAPDPQDTFRLCFVGRLEKVKNPIALVDAIASLRKQGVPTELWVIGEGSQRSELEQYIELHELEGVVRLWGYKSNPMEYVSQCNLFVQPSLSEGFSIALVEAMGTGVPVLTTKVGGAPKIIIHGQTGWLVDCPDSSALASALRETWSKSDKLAEIGAAGRRAVENRFDPSNYIKKLDALYDSQAKL